MARTISVADDVYEWMKRKKGEKSFSELIRELRKDTEFEELTDTGVSRNWENVRKGVKSASNENIDRIEEEYA